MQERLTTKPKKLNKTETEIAFESARVCLFEAKTALKEFQTYVISGKTRGSEQFFAAASQAALALKCIELHEIEHGVLS